MADGTFGRAWRGTFERLAAPADCLPAGFDALKRRPAAASKPLRDVGKRLRGLQGGHDRPLLECSDLWTGPRVVRFRDKHTHTRYLA